MKFELKIATMPKVKGGPDRFQIVEFEGELEAVKTYCKLKAGPDFNWAAVTRLGELKTGDVDRWFIRRNFTSGDLEMSVFSFYNVAAHININAMKMSFEGDRTSSGAINKLLGGGKL